MGQLIRSNFRLNLGQDLLVNQFHSQETERHQKYLPSEQNILLPREEAGIWQMNGRVEIQGIWLIILKSEIIFVQ